MVLIYDTSVVVVQNQMVLLWCNHITGKSECTEPPSQRGGQVAIYTRMWPIFGPRGFGWTKGEKRGVTYDIHVVFGQMWMAYDSTIGRRRTLDMRNPGGYLYTRI